MKRLLLLASLITALVLVAGCVAVAGTANVVAVEETARSAPALCEPAPEGTPDAASTEIMPAATPEASATAVSPTPGVPSPTGAAAAVSLPAMPPSPSPSPSASPSPSHSMQPTAAPSPTEKPYEVDEMDDTDAYLAVSSANLREGPGTEYGIVRELAQGRRMILTGICGEWYRVETGSSEGFILAEFVKLGQAATPAPTHTPAPTKSPEPSLTPTTAPESSPAPTDTPELSPEPTETPQPTHTPAPTKSPSPSKTPSGTSPLDADEFFPDSGRYTAEELLLTAQVVHQESKYTSLEAQMAVANTIYNRLISPKYADDLESIIFQKNQYTVASNEAKIRAVVPAETAVEAVKRIFVDGEAFLPEDIMFFRSARLGHEWSSKYEYYATYGNNCFFRRS